MKRLAVLACAGLAATAAGCGEKGSSGSTVDTKPGLQATGPQAPAKSGGGPRVAMRNIKFVPPTIVARAGQTVRWVNADAVPHNVVAREGASFRSSILQPGKSFSYKVAKKGTITYVCTLHPNMTGKVVAGG